MNLKIEIQIIVHNALYEIIFRFFLLKEQLFHTYISIKFVSKRRVEERMVNQKVNSSESSQAIQSTTFEADCPCIGYTSPKKNHAGR